MKLRCALLRAALCSAPLLAVSLGSSGCLTTLLWQDFEWTETYSVEIRGDDPEEPPQYAKRTEAHVLSGVGRVLLTPLTVAVDITTFVVWIWLESETTDEC